LRGLFERDIHINGSIIAIEVNLADEIVVLRRETYQRFSLIRLTQDGTILKSFQITDANINDFAIKVDKYVLCSQNQLIVLNDAGESLSRFNISVGSNPGICIAPNEQIYISFRKSSKLQIWSYDSECVLKKKYFSPLNRFINIKPRFLSSGRLAITVKKEHTVFIFDA
jgi:hypothetical protein